MKRSIDSMTADELRELIRADLSTDGAPSDDAIAASERLAELESADIPDYSTLAPAAQSTAKPRRTRFIIRTALVAAAAICALAIMTTAGMFRNELKEDWEAAAFDVTSQPLRATHAIDIDTHDEVWLEQRYTADGTFGRLISVRESDFTPNGEPHVWFNLPTHDANGNIINPGKDVITYGDSRYGVDEDAAVVYIGEPYSEEAVAACRSRKSPFDPSDSENTLKLPIGTLDENGRYSLKIGENGVNNDSTAYFNIYEYGTESLLDAEINYIDSLEPWQPITFVTPEEMEQDIVYSAVIYFDGRRLLIDYRSGDTFKPMAEVLADDGVDITLPTMPDGFDERNMYSPRNAEARKSMTDDRILYHIEWEKDFSVNVAMDIAQYFDPDSRIPLETAVGEQLENAEVYEYGGTTYYYLKDERGGNFRIVWQTDDCDCRIVGLYPENVEAVIASMHAE